MPVLFGLLQLVYHLIWNRWNLPIVERQQERLCKSLAVLKVKPELFSEHLLWSCSLRSLKICLKSSQLSQLNHHFWNQAFDWHFSCRWQWSLMWRKAWTSQKHPEKHKTSKNNVSRTCQFVIWCFGHCFIFPQIHTNPKRRAGASGRCASEQPDEPWEEIQALLQTCQVPRKKHTQSFSVAHGIIFARKPCDERFSSASLRRARLKATSRVHNLGKVLRRFAKWDAKSTVHLEVTSYAHRPRGLLKGQNHEVWFRFCFESFNICKVRLG